MTFTQEQQDMLGWVVCICATLSCLGSCFILFSYNLHSRLNSRRSHNGIITSTTALLGNQPLLPSLPRNGGGHAAPRCQFCPKSEDEYPLVLWMTVANIISSLNQMVGSVSQLSRRNKWMLNDTELCKVSGFIEEATFLVQAMYVLCIALCMYRLWWW